MMFRVFFVFIFCAFELVATNEEKIIQQCLNELEFVQKNVVVILENKLFVFFERDNNHFSFEYFFQPKLVRKIIRDHVKEKINLCNYDMEIYLMPHLPLQSNGDVDVSSIRRALGEELQDSEVVNDINYLKMRRFIELERTDFLELPYIQLQSSIDPKQLIVAFAGFYPNYVPHFEFQKTFSNYDVMLCNVRDLQNSFFMRGLDFNTNDYNVVEHLSSVIKNSKLQMVKFIGSSAGAWAAIYFGILLDVDEVCALSPVFWGHAYPIDSLLKLLESNKLDYRTKIKVYFSKNCVEDLEYATRLSLYKNVHLFPYDGYTNHDTAGYLITNNLYPEIIKNFLNIE